MKATIFFLFVVLTTCSQAQSFPIGKNKTIPKPVSVDNGNTSAQPVTEGRAKTFIKLYTTNMEKAKTEPKASVVAQYLRKASEAIENIKKFDPSFNVRPLEDELERMSKANDNLANEQVDASRARSNNNDKGGDGVAGLFMGETTTEIRNTGNADEDIANHKLQISAYNQKVEKLIAAGATDTKRYENYIQNLSTSATQQIKKLEEQINKAENKSGMIAYRELIGIETYWSAAKKIFTNVSEAAQVQNLAAVAIQKVGTEEEVAVKIRRNYEDKIRNKKMPAAVMVNAALESDFRRVFNNSFKELTIIKINIIAREWTVIRNEVTGIILGRKHSAAIAVKTKENTCALYYFHIGQPYTGSGYGLSAENARGYDGELLCENIK